MKILCIADEENKGLWDHFQREKLEGVDLILSAVFSHNGESTTPLYPWES